MNSLASSQLTLVTGSISPPPSRVGRTVFATPRRHAAIPFRKGHLAAADGEVLVMATSMNGRFGRLGVRAHLEFAGRDDDELDAIGAVAKRLPGQSRLARRRRREPTRRGIARMRRAARPARACAKQPCDQRCAMCALHHLRRVIAPRASFPRTINWRSPNKNRRAKPVDSNHRLLRTLQFHRSR